MHKNSRVSAGVSRVMNAAGDVMTAVSRVIKSVGRVINKVPVVMTGVAVVMAAVSHVISSIGRVIKAHSGVIVSSTRVNSKIRYTSCYAFTVIPHLAQEYMSKTKSWFKHAAVRCVWRAWILPGVPQ